MKKNNLFNIFFIFLILFLLLFLLFFYNAHKKKTICIFGSVSKDISNDFDLQKDLKHLSLNLNTSKYDYIIPNSQKGTIGYILDNINDEDKKNITTACIEKFYESDTNKNYKIITFDDPIKFEEYMIKNSNIFIILPGGIGTLYEISFLLYLIDVSDVDNKILFYNKDNYYNFIDDIVKNYYKNGYLRDYVYNKFKSSTYFFNNIEELIKFI